MLLVLFSKCIGYHCSQAMGYDRSNYIYHQKRAIDVTQRKTLSRGKLKFVSKNWIEEESHSSLFVTLATSSNSHTLQKFNGTRKYYFAFTIVVCEKNLNFISKFFEISNTFEYLKNNNVQLYLVTEWSNLHFDFLNLTGNIYDCVTKSINITVILLHVHVYFWKIKR